MHDPSELTQEQKVFHLNLPQRAQVTVSSTMRTTRPSAPQVFRGEGVRRNHHGGRSLWEPWKLWLVFVLLFVDLAGVQLVKDQNLTCYGCTDEERCPDLLTIYKSDDTVLYRRDINKTFPECVGILPSAPCDVCYVQSNLTIRCSKGVGGFEVEGAGTSISKDHILEVSCPDSSDDGGNLISSSGLIASCFIFLVPLLVILVCTCE